MPIHVGAQERLQGGIVSLHFRREADYRSPGPADGIGRDQQILATAEAYDELMHNGPHGPDMTAEEALARLQKEGYDQ
ncbi:MAG TPA: hypothetical protein PLQ12_05550, partial [Candidatus Defluviicoccus seviourii]|nr:hypothetical protein [Candidatus Defluviicoccus seviourii]